MKLLRSIQAFIDRMLAHLYLILTENYYSAPITRTSVVLLDVWQAYVLYYHNYWIPQLVAPEAPVDAFIVYSVALATLAVVSLFMSSTNLAAVVLMINIAQYMYLTFAALFILNPPRASAGMTGFITLVCMSSLWRLTFLLISRRRRKEDRKGIS